MVLLEEVLNDAIQSAQNQIAEKNPSLENKEEIAKQVGVGAVIFHDLKNDRLNTFDFTLEEVVRFEGETTLCTIHLCSRNEYIKKSRVYPR